MCSASFLFSLFLLFPPGSLPGQRCAPRAGRRWHGHGWNSTGTGVGTASALPETSTVFGGCCNPAAALGKGTFPFQSNFGEHPPIAGCAGAQGGDVHWGGTAPSLSPLRRDRMGRAQWGWGCGSWHGTAWGCPECGDSKVAATSPSVGQHRRALGLGGGYGAVSCLCLRNIPCPPRSSFLSLVHTHTSPWALALCGSAS